MSTPALSFVVVCDGFEWIAELVESLQRQSARDRIELVVVAFDDAGFELDEAATAGLAVQVVQTERSMTATARNAGVRAARAPLVFVGETHCYPEPGFAEAIMSAHDEGYDAVVPVFVNGNPKGAISWSSFLLGYGRNAVPAPSVDLDQVPAYNTSYRRSLYLEHGDKRLRIEPILGADAPGRFCRSSAARMAHVNVATVRGLIADRYSTGRAFGSERSRDWSIGRRLLYACGAPLIPLVYLLSVLRTVGLSRFARLPLSTLPVMVVGAFIWAFGEVAGYIAGLSQHALDLGEEIELHRHAYLGRA